MFAELHSPVIQISQTVQREWSESNQFLLSCLSKSSISVVRAKE